MIPEIEHKVREIGFDFFAVVRPPDLTFRKEFLLDWINRGFHGQMNYLTQNIEKRVSPYELYPPVKSIIIVGVSYNSFPWDTLEKEERGLISKYAVRRDYHRVIKKNLKKLLNFLKEKDQSIEGRIFVDSAPLLEKELARLAGVGFFGKNTLLINKNLGSYFFLGELFLNVELEEVRYSPLPLLCSSCTKCIDICPTGAIVKPYLLNASRCISYLTVEYKGIIDEELEDKMGNWIFGCDLCQEVCPFNKKNKSSDSKLLPHNISLANMKLEKLILLKEEEYEEIFQGTPVKRAGYRTFMRNVFIAAGNSGDKKFLELLEKRKKDFEEDSPAGYHLRRAIAKLT